MLEKPRVRLSRLPDEDRNRVGFSSGCRARTSAVLNDERFAAVLCHGVLGYLEHPEPLLDQLCRCADVGGIVSILTGNARAMAVRPAMERRWADALAAFDARAEVGVSRPSCRPPPRMGEQRGERVTQ